MTEKQISKLIDSFQEINEFIYLENRLPEINKTNICERGLRARLN